MITNLTQVTGICLIETKGNPKVIVKSLYDSGWNDKTKKEMCNFYFQN